MSNFRNFQLEIIGLKLSIQVHATSFMPFKSLGLLRLAVCICYAYRDGRN